MDIHGKTVIITGASEGIGAAAAHLLAAHGAKVVLAARSADKLNAVADAIKVAGGSALAIVTDMRDQESVKRMIEQAHQAFGKIDILINNAGQSVGGMVESLNLDAYREVIDLNVFGVLYAMQAVVPLMRPRGGLILNISSMVSKMAIPGIGGYASTKYMLNGLTLTAREELAKDNIRVILVYPRLTTTNFVQNGLRYQGFGTPRPPGSAPNGQAASGRPPADSAEHVAAKILEAIQNEPAEQFMD